jgi:hypothetical protein
MTELEFQNILPAVPFPPKFVIHQPVPGSLNGLAHYFMPDLDYQRSSLEESMYQFPLNCGASVGCPLDFIDVARFRIPPQKPGEPAPAVHPDDAELLQDEMDSMTAMRADLLKQFWVQKEFISENPVHDDQHHISHMERNEQALAKAKANERRVLEAMQAGKTTVERIVDGFAFVNPPALAAAAAAGGDAAAAAAAALPPHPTKGDQVRPVRSWPLLPHAQLHGRRCVANARAAVRCGGPSRTD